MIGATVLVVEDEAPVREVIAAALEREGYAVLEASCGAEALDVCRRHPGPIELVLSDVLMPSMRGDELVPQLLDRRPGMRALYMSGYLAGVPRQAVTPLLEKPFTLQSLTSAVHDLLAPPRAA